jgi:hypothetical protein
LAEAPDASNNLSEDADPSQVDASAPGDSSTCLSADAGGAAAALLDPARPTLTYECSGPPLTPGQIAGQFNPGVGMLGIVTNGSLAGNLVLRGNIPLLTYTQTCTPLTGCSAYQESTGPWRVIAFLLAADGTLTAQEQLNGTTSGTTPIPVTSGDFLLQGSDTLIHVIMTAQPNGTTCVSETSDITSSSAGTSFTVGQTILGPPPAGSMPSDLPPFDDTSVCRDAPADDATISTSWFAPCTTVSVPFITTTQSAQRFCHPLTGCSAWVTPCDPPPTPSDLTLCGSSYIVGFPNGDFLPLTSGSFSGPVEAPWQAQGVVGSTCMFSTATATVPVNPSTASLPVLTNSGGEPNMGPDVTFTAVTRSRITPGGI